MLKNSSKYVRNQNFIFRKVVEEMILVPIHEDVADMDCIYTLNEVGAFIWGLLEKPVTLTELYRAVQDEYEMPEAVIENDVNQFLSDLIDYGALREA